MEKRTGRGGGGESRAEQRESGEREREQSRAEQRKRAERERAEQSRAEQRAESRTFKTISQPPKNLKTTNDRRFYISVDALQGHLAANGAAPYPASKAAKLLAGLDDVEGLLSKGQ